MKTDGLTPEEINEKHAYKMAKKKAARDKILARKTLEKGLLMVHTGKGKGKSTAAMGLAIRAIGNGMKVGIVQYVKGVWSTGEREVLERRFYDLGSDPDELDPLSWEGDDGPGRLLSRLSLQDPDPGGRPERVQRGTRPGAVTIDPRVSEEQLEKLRGLGYAE